MIFQLIRMGVVLEFPASTSFAGFASFIKTEIQSERSLINTQYGICNIWPIHNINI